MSFDVYLIESLCDARAIVGLIVYSSAAVTLVRFIMSFSVFLAMRDYRREIWREEMLEKRIQQELDERFREYQRRQAAKNTSKRTRDRPLAAS